MNDMQKSALMPDVQASNDTRQIVIDRVGVKGVKMPLQIATTQGVQPSVGMFDLDVLLPADQKGTHMSRFMALLEQSLSPLSPSVMAQLTEAMLGLLEATAGQIDVRFPYFRQKKAPVSEVASLMDYSVRLFCKSQAGVVSSFVEVLVPVTSLCPCSKKISDYGAHNQRSHITIFANINDQGQDTIQLADDLIAIAEREASCELWGILKRPDEKYVTERAYDNPKFVEDLVRDVAKAVGALSGVQGYRVEAENFESIHNHSAYAVIDRL